MQDHSVDNERMIWLGLVLDTHASVLHRVSADAQTEEIVEVMYRFLLGCGHDPWNVARAMVGVGTEHADAFDRQTPDEQYQAGFYAGDYVSEEVERDQL